MKIKYKKIKQLVPHCGDCGEPLMGNGSILAAYRCSCGMWLYDYYAGECKKFNPKNK